MTGICARKSMAFFYSALLPLCSWTWSNDYTLKFSDMPQIEKIQKHDKKMSLKSPLLQICACLIRTSSKGKGGNTAITCNSFSWFFLIRDIWITAFRWNKDLIHSKIIQEWVSSHLPYASRTSSHASWLSASGTPENHRQWSVASKAILQAQKRGKS